MKRVLEPGDSVAFHMLTLHSGEGAKALLLVFSIWMLVDDIIHAPRSWKTSTDFPSFSDQLHVRKLMDHEFSRLPGLLTRLN